MRDRADFRIKAVYNVALAVFGDAERAREFLRKPHQMLRQRAPENLVAASNEGADVVIKLIGRAAYGGGV